MPLESVDLMMRKAIAGRYAVGYFESWNLESLQGVVDAAEATRSPMILGFNGDFLSRPERLAAERIDWYAELGKTAAASASVPCGLIFNECPRDEWVGWAIKCGFNLVMPADSRATFSAACVRVAAMARLAHRHGVAVEAEVGELPCGVGGHPGSESPTDPDIAREFVAETGIDLLAISVGNVHIKLEGDKPLDLDRIEAIRRSVEIPLVLHGGTGIAPDSLIAAIRLGVAKVNFGTYLKQRYLRALRSGLAINCPDPHRMLGMGGAEDILVAGRHAVRDAVLERLELLGCCGKADSSETS